MLQDAHAVSHDPGLMQCRLSIDQQHITIHQVSVHDAARLREQQFRLRISLLSSLAAQVDYQPILSV